MPVDRATDALPPYARMGPSFLAAEPTETDEPKASSRDPWPDYYAHFEGRLGAQRTWRWTWWATWGQLAEYILPRRYHWLITPNRMTRGGYINTSILDGTATLALNICASGLWTGLTSPSRPWFKIEISPPGTELDSEAKEWLAEVEKRHYAILNGSNFYTATAQFFMDVSCFGTAVMIDYEDDETLVRFYNPCLGEYFLSAGGRLSDDVLYREFNYTVSQIVDMFGLESCPQEVIDLWQKKGASLERELRVCHAIEPNFDISGSAGSGRKVPMLVPPRFAFREVYWIGGKRATGPLSVRGFYERPFVAGVWSRTSNDPYGRGPGHDALGDIKQLQRETLRKEELVEKLANPPMGADASLKNEPASTLPASITYMDTSAGGNRKFFPLYEVNPQALAALAEDLDKVRERINRYFFVDVFLAITKMEGVQPRNELEITKRDLERLQVLGPFITHFENEVASPIIMRNQAIMERLGLIPPRPPSIRDRQIKVSYTSIMRQAQQAMETVGMKDFLQVSGATAAAAQASGSPSPLRLVDLDKFLKIYGERVSLAPQVLKSDDQVRKEDRRRAAQQQQLKNQAAMAQLAQTATTGVQAAKVLSDTPTGGQTALSAILGGQ